MFYARTSKRHLTGGECVACCGLPALTMQLPDMGRATQIPGHAQKTDRGHNVVKYGSTKQHLHKLPYKVLDPYNLSCITQYWHIPPRGCDQSAKTLMPDIIVGDLREMRPLRLLVLECARCYSGRTRLGTQIRFIGSSLVLCDWLNEPLLDFTI